MRCTAGEAWAQESLARLRDEGFSATAIGRFLGASRSRASDTRAARPQLRRQSRRWAVIGAGGWLLLASQGSEPYRRRVRSGLTWWAGVTLMLDWHLGMFETEDGIARALGPADALTLARAWLVPVLADSLKPSVVLAAAATDLLDGAAARATATTRAGRDLEGLVDGTAALAALIGARRTDALTPAAIGIELARLSTGLAYGTHAYLVRTGSPDPAISRASRSTTPLRVAGLVLAASGRRAPGSALLVAGSLLGLAATARGARVQQAVTSAACRSAILDRA